VSNKIDKWHKKISLKKIGTFSEDSDFLAFQKSPSKFVSSGETTPNSNSVMEIQSNISIDGGSPLSCNLVSSPE
jgi:hypothetical protein